MINIWGPDLSLYCGLGLIPVSLVLIERNMEISISPPLHSDFAWLWRRFEVFFLMSVKHCNFLFISYFSLSHDI